MLFRSVVRVPVNDQFHRVRMEQLFDLGRIDIHDGHGFFLLCRTAAFTHAGNQCFAIRQWPGEKSRLPCWVANLSAELHVARVIDALRIAVHKPQPDTVLVLVVEDNLCKGASGQAVQCMNLMFGVPEKMGLQQVALLP